MHWAGCSRRLRQGNKLTVATGLKRKGAIAWALYDFANSGFATTVMAGLFPIFFKKFFCAGIDPAISTARLGWGNSAASLAVALIAPFAGAAADACTGSKRILLWLTLSGALFTALLAVPAQGQWLLALSFYGAALFSFAGGNIFYDALLNSVALPGERDRVSSLGFALGYLGGGILLVANALMVTSPERWGIGSAEQAVRLSFLTVSVWWMVFSMPLFLAVQEDGRSVSCDTAALEAIFSRIRGTFLHLRSMKGPLVFLAAYWLYMDGVSSVIRMAVDYGLSIGIDTKGLITALVIVQFTGFPATLIMGRAAERFGTRNTILAGIAAYGAVTVYASLMHTIEEFMVLAAVIGLFQGSLQALSRSFFAQMVPRGSEAEFFGFYNIMGRFAAVLGPAMIGTVAAMTGSSRAGILVLLPMFGAGGFLLMKVKE